jgi:hypothetical protein
MQRWFQRSDDFNDFERSVRASRESRHAGTKGKCSAAASSGVLFVPLCVRHLKAWLRVRSCARTFFVPFL